MISGGAKDTIRIIEKLTSEGFLMSGNGYSPTPADGFLEQHFKLREHGTNVKTELLGGLTTFLTMAYILAVNPSILGDAGMDRTAVMLGTALASAIATILMGLLANLPFALSAGMGLNAYFAYTVVLGHGYPWQLALFCVFIEGLIFIVLSITHVREMIFNVIPHSLKLAISAGIGMFIFFIGLQNSGIVIGNSSTLVGLINFRADFSTAGICALLTVIGMFVTFVLYVRRVRGSILLGILVTWGLGIVCQLVGLYIPNPEAGFYPVYPTFSMTDFSALGNTLGQCFKLDFSGINPLDILIVTLTFLYTDIFDTIGTLIGGATKGNMLDENGKLPRIREALLADSIGTTVGAMFGTSTVTTFVESSSGIAAGARTGLAAVVTGVLFLVSTFAASLFTSIPSFATAPALLVVGFLMFTSAGHLALTEEKEYINMIPAFLCIASMLIFYSIAEGIAIGVLAYVVMHVACGKGRKVNLLMYLLALVFLAKYILL